LGYNYFENKGGLWGMKMGVITNLWFFGVMLGLKTIYKLKTINLRILEMIILPMNYWRCIETPLILKGLNPKKEEEILDIGSPKLLSLFLAKKFGAKVISSDINEYFINYSKNFSKILGIKDRYNIKTIDARKINLKDNSIDKVYSLSVFEHIPKEGDKKAIKEVKRILKNNGIFILTIPYTKDFKVEYKNPRKFYYSNSKKREKVFYQRYYDEKALDERIITPSGMTLIDKKYVGQKSKLLSKFSFPFFSFLNLILSKLNHSGPSENLENVKNPCMAYLVLKK